MSKRMNRLGFTLIEIMMVVVIIGLLVAMVGPRIAGKAELAKVESSKASMMALASMVEMYCAGSGPRPLTPTPDLSKFGNVPTDPWGVGFAISGDCSNFTITGKSPKITTLTYNSATGQVTP